MKWKQKALKLNPKLKCKSHGATKGLAGQQIKVFAIFIDKEQITKYYTNSITAWENGYKRENKS